MRSRTAINLSLWPKLNILDGMIILDDRKPVAFWELSSLLNPMTAASSRLKEAQKRFQASLNSLKPGETVQLVVEGKRYNPEKDIEKMKQRVKPNAPEGHRVFYSDFLGQHLAHHCATTFVPVLKMYLLFTYEQPKPYLKGFVREKGLSLLELQKMVDRRGRDFAQSVTNSQDLLARQLKKDEIIEILDYALNPGDITSLNTAAYHSVKPVADVLGPGRDELLFRSDIMERDNFSHIQVNKTLVQTISFYRPPEPTGEGFLTDLLLKGELFRFSLVCSGERQEWIRGAA